MTFSDLFKVTIVQRQIKWKRYSIQLYLQWPTNRKSYRTAPFSMTLNDSYPSFKVTPFFDAEYLINGTTYRHSFSEIPIGTYTRPTQQCHFEWPSLTLSDSAKYSMTRRVARSLCDSWGKNLSCRREIAQESAQVLWTEAAFSDNAIDDWHGRLRACMRKRRTHQATIVTIFSHMTKHFSFFKCDDFQIVFCRNYHNFILINFAR